MRKHAEKNFRHIYTPQEIFRIILKDFEIENVTALKLLKTRSELDQELELN